jgi:ABC-type branched-subunit amino acid transport system ATPase component/ABC-type branched-subunit amino acid transport system permease subunit
MKAARSILPRVILGACVLVLTAGVFVAADRTLDRGLPIGVVASGVVFGSLNALVAVGLVLVYRSHRVINFAQAELGLVATVVGIHLAVSLEVNWFVAAAAAVALGAITGAVVEVGVLRRFARAPRLLVAVATIGLAQVLTALALLLPGWLGTRPDLSGFRVPIDATLRLQPFLFGGSEIFAVAIVPVVLGLVGLALTRTDRGLALRAVPDNPERAFLVGMPVRSLGTLAWASAGALSAVATLVRVPILSFQGFDSLAAGGPSLLLATLAAGVVGRMSSLPVTAAAAVALGIVASVASWVTSNSAVVDLILVGVILVTLLARSRERYSRIVEDALGSWRALRPVRPVPAELAALPEVRVARVAAFVSTTTFALTVPLWASPSQEQIAGLIAIYALIGVSLVVLTGWAGQISLGQFAFAGLGASTTGVLLARHGWDLFMALAAGAAVAALLSVVVGAPALRARGPYLAVTTLGLAIAGSAFLFDERYMPWFIERDVARPVLLGRVPIDADWKMYFVALGALALGLVMARNLRGTTFGRSIVAVRDNRAAAEGAGVAPTSVTISAFAFSGALAGLAGGIYVLHQGGITTNAFPPAFSLSVFAMSVIGGLGSFLGPVIGAAYVIGARFWLHGPWTLLGTGAGLLLLLMFAPGGLGDLVYRGRDALLRSVARLHRLHVASMLVDDRHAPDGLPDAVEPTSRIAEPILRCRNLHLSRDGVGVVFGFDLDVAPGEIVAILGTNGSGKSTILRAISGLLEPDEGAIEFEGRPLRGRASEIAAVPGGHGIFPTLSVRENLLAASWTHRRRKAARARAIDEAFATFPLLRARSQQAAGSLSGGEQQMLSLAQAFIARPRLLLIDELSLGLAPVAIEGLSRVVRALNERGVTIVLVEQSPARAATLASRAVWIEKGRVRFEGSIDDLVSRADLVRAVYVPATAGANGRRRSAQREPVLEVRGVSKRYGGIRAVDRVDLTVDRGEIVGLVGSNGAGKTTLLDLIAGAAPVDAGTIRLGGADVTNWTGHRRARSGVARSFQDSLLWGSVTVRESIGVALTTHARINAMVPSLLRLPSIVASERALMSRVDELIELFSLGAFANKFVSELSTGSRRLVDLAGMVAQQPVVLLLDEPSSGLAHGEADALLPVLDEVRDRTGCSMIVVEHHLPLIRSLSDRLVAMEAGSVIGRGSPSDVLSAPAVVDSLCGPIISGIGEATNGRAGPSTSLIGVTAVRVDSDPIGTAGR